MKYRAAAKGRRLSLLAAVSLISTLLAVPAAEASRSLPAALAPVLEAPVAPASVLDEKPAEPQPHYRLFGDLSLPERPLELVQIEKTASGVSTCKPRLNIRQTGGLSRNCGGPSFQGLWTDPVTGIAYARARWYDARNAVFLTEDPVGDTDSPNLYAFVAWQPNMYTDPLGEQSLRELRRDLTDYAFDDGHWWAIPFAFAADLGYAVANAATIGTIDQIDDAQEALDSGEIDRAGYWKQVGFGITRTVVTYVGGGIAGRIGAGAAGAVLGRAGGSAIGGALVSGAAASAGSTASLLASDAFGMATGLQDGFSSARDYAFAAGVGLAMGTAFAAGGEVVASAGRVPESAAGAFTPVKFSNNRTYALLPSQKNPSVRRWQRMRPQTSASNPTQRHHSLAKFLGGDADQLLTSLPRSVHTEFHSLLTGRLRAAGMPRVGGVGGSTLDWQRYMRANPGSQKKAFDILLGVSREVDYRHGVRVTTDVWDNILNGRFTAFP